jgi:DNA-binding GntR family transcriptional regulator
LVILAEQVYQRLRNAILDGRLTPGAPLSHRRLAEDMGISTVPVADAILRLSAEGLVESRPRAGTRVRAATPEEIRGNYILREALETHSARLFAESAKPRYRKRLLAAAEQLDRAYRAFGRQRTYSRDKHARIERRHIRFHMMIAEATECPMLVSAIERSRVLLLNSIFTEFSEFQQFPDNWHLSLAEVLVQNDPEAAAAAMRTHVRFRQEEVMERFRQLAKSSPSDGRMVRGPQRRAGRPARN